MIRGTYHGSVVAIKQLKGVYSITPSQFQEFEQEIKSLNTLNHPNLVDFVGVVVEPGKLWVVMQYLSFIMLMFVFFYIMRYYPNGSLYDLLHLKKVLHDNYG